MEKSPRIVACIPICEEDTHWLGQLFSEIERMDVDASWLLNNCSQETTRRIEAFKGTVFAYKYDGIFHNCLRNYPLEGIEKDYDWMLQWDADETWEPDAPTKLRELLRSNEHGLIQVRMAHAWEKDGKMMFTSDFSTERDRVYNLRGFLWRYLERVVAGPTNLMGDDMGGKIPLWMVHWGYSTKERREKHKRRWDRIHSRSQGSNPYGTWRELTVPGYEPSLYPIDDIGKVL